MTIADNLSRVRENIAAACARAGRDPSAVTLVAVSKTHPALAVHEAAVAGVQHFGENRVEEAVTKIPAVSRLTDQLITWHMIGHVQSRKVKDVLPLFQIVHSVDTLKLAEKFSKAMQSPEVPHRGAALDVLLEVNISGEASKSGFAARGWNPDPAVREALWREIEQVVALPGLRVRGLMTMAPIVPDMEQARPVFADLAALRAALAGSLNVALPDLSMGMTDDYPVAIEEGATLVRIGRAIFGERQ
jgi:pyridoxal phosphate enzyme (YggS family)